MPIKIKRPNIPETEHTPLVNVLLGLIEQMMHENSRKAETIQQLRDEIAILNDSQG